MVHQSNIGIGLDAGKIDLEIQTEHEASPAHQAQELQITTLANPGKQASLSFRISRSILIVYST